MPETIIRPSGGWSALQLRELWERRELVWIFGWRDVAIRYKQTALGIGWAVIQPIMMMVVFSIVFGRFAKVPSDGFPYPIFSYAGILPWTLFAASITAVGMSVVNAAQLVKRAYIPRLIFPISACVPPLVDFAIAFVVLVGLMVWYQVVPPAAIVALPLLVLMICLTALALGLWLSVLNVYYRDFRYVLPFAVQMLMFLSPVIYPPSVLEGPLRTVFLLNPMFGVIQAFRACVLGTEAPDWTAFAVSAAVVAALLAGGLLFFRRFERRFADVI